MLMSHSLMVVENQVSVIILHGQHYFHQLQEIDRACET